MKLYFIAGEDSGDLHTSNLIKALKELTPSLLCRGVGGDKMASQGVELIAHVRDINFMGFAEVVANLSTIRKLFQDVEKDILHFRPDAVVLTDYPGFNLRMAKFLKAHGVKTIYYISPQVWAWKKRRVKTIKNYTDKMMVILPFEKDFYEKEGLEVEFVGHPLLDVIDEKMQKVPKKEGLIALLPGSRKQEISRMLPVMLESIPHFPDFQFVIGGAPSQSEGFYQELIRDAPVGLRMNQTYELLQEADYALVTSGTATLETALFRVPQVVAYRGSKLSYAIGKRLVNVDFISLVNLILGRKAVSELIQNDYTSENLILSLKKLMEAAHHQKLQEDYQELWEKLGAKGASERAAQVVVEQLGTGA